VAGPVQWHERQRQVDDKNQRHAYDWLGSSTVDEWDLPLDAKAQSGKVRMQGHTYTLGATKA
jgi:hypothetical protein